MTELDSQQLYEATIPSVVSVYVNVGDRRRRGSGSGFVFAAEQPGSSNRRATSNGNGYVLTNDHVVGDAAEAELRFADGQWRVGRVVGHDRYTDLAVLAVDDLPEAAAPLELADDPPKPGAPVAAFGNPMGLDGSISVGIVSGANRSMPTGNGFTIPDTVQTDAVINPGNSGGPLVDAAGRVVSVNRAKGGDNIGFAVSAAVLARVVPALIDDGRYDHPYLRVRTLDVSPSVARANELNEPQGVLVVDVAEGPAEGVLHGSRTTRRVDGVEVPVGGDIILAVDGEATDSHEALLRHLLLEAEPGQAVTLRLLRRGVETTEAVVLATRPAPEQRRRGRRRRQARSRGNDRRAPDRDDSGVDIPVR
jgi:S1-C subfamily serine protease